MAIVRLALSNPSADTDTLLHTATRQSIVSVIATNTASANAEVDIWVQPVGASVSSQYAYFAKGTVVPANNSLETFRFSLESGDGLYVRSSTDNISFSVNAIHESSGNYNIVTVSDNEPLAPTIGDVWVLETNTYVKFWDGTEWLNAIPGSAGYATNTEPALPQEGQLWVDLDGIAITEPEYAKSFYSPTDISASLGIGDTGTLWTNSNNDILYVWDGSAWVNPVTVSRFQSASPTGSASGEFWVDSDDSSLYVWNGTSWDVVSATSATGGGATGGGTDQVFYENDTIVSADYTITSGKNAGSFGPIEISASVTVEIPSGSVWTIV